MIISDGTTNLTFTGTRHDDFLNVEKSRNVSAGGRIKSQTSGRRFVVVENIRCTAAQVETLIELLTNGASYYYYTPTNTPGYMESGDFPMQVNIDMPKKTGFDWNGAKYYHVELNIESTDYVTT